MKKIGITGGVGAGKSIILDFLKDNCHCRILQADELAWELEEKGNVCYEPLVELLGKEILAPDGSIDRKKMGKIVFSDPALLKAVNGIVHPAVCDRIKEEAGKAKSDGFDFFFLEAALMIEGKCDILMDEIWYVYAPKKERIRRLIEDRGYTKEKALSIMRGQLSEKEFRLHADRVIRNDRDPETVFEQIRKWLT